jgi:hypothetical protein
MKKIIIGLVLMASSQLSAQYGQFGLVYGSPVGKANELVKAQLGLVANYGYFVSKHVGLGLTTKLILGIGRYGGLADRTETGASLAFSPRINFIDGDVTPFISLDIGFATNDIFNLQDAEQQEEHWLRNRLYVTSSGPRVSNLPSHGLYYEPTIGMRFHALGLSLGYATYYKTFSYINAQLTAELGHYSRADKQQAIDQKKRIQALDKEVEEALEKQKTDNNARF